MALPVAHRELLSLIDMSLSPFFKGESGHATTILSKSFDVYQYNASATGHPAWQATCSSDIRDKVLAKRNLAMRRLLLPNRRYP